LEEGLLTVEDVEDLKLHLAFDDQSESFVLGWEASKIYHELEAAAKTSQPILDYSSGFPLHYKNKDLYKRMAELFCYTVNFIDYPTEYTFATFVFSNELKNKSKSTVSSLRLVVNNGEVG
jgi:hypothetical protein